MYCLYGNIIKFSRTSQIHFCYKVCHWNQWGKWPQNPPFPWGTWTPSNTWMPGATPLTTQMTAQSLHALPQYVTKAPLVTKGRQKFTPKTALPLQWSPPPSNTAIPRLTPPPPQTASRSNQLFCHNTLCGPTDRPTHRWSRRMFCNTSVLLAMLTERCANNYICQVSGVKLVDILFSFLYVCLCVCAHSFKWAESHIVRREMYLTRAWKVENTSIWTIYRWNLCFIGFLMI